MTQPVFSESWYRVADLRPRLRAHARISRHLYRGTPWYVLEDTARQGLMRFTPATHAVIGLMDGQRTVHELWEITTETLGDEAPTQDEMIHLLAQLHHADVLQCDVPPDAAELLERAQERERKRWMGRLLSPLAIKVPLVDPDAFLRRWAPRVRPLVGRAGALLWLAVVLPALFQVGAHWDELTQGVLDQILAPQNLVLIWLLFPLIKALHELGHGIATRVFGGEVHDMGVMLLVFTPVPYVDASSASAFPEKRRRAQVAAAGMVVEVFLAALAFYLWVAVEPGVVRTLAYNAMLIAGVTTITFNANPLLRFDGYYILSDLIEVPNLRQRANQHLRYLFEHYALGLPDAEPVDASRGEKAWLLAFGIASPIYRIMLIALILLFVLQLSLVLGVLLAGITVLGWLLGPIASTVKMLLTSPRTRPVRGRVQIVIGGGLAALLAITCLLPLPYRSRAEGIVWIPDEAFVRAGTDCFVRDVVAEPGALVRAGDVLFECLDRELDALVGVLKARADGLQVRLQQARLDQPMQMAILEEAVRLVRRQLARAEERREELTLRASTNGSFVVPREQDLPGRFVRKGEIVGYVIQPEAVRIRAAVPEEAIELVRDRLEGIEVRRTDRVGEVVPARLARLAPAATNQLPSVALGTAGGGSLAVDPRDPEGASTVEKVFEVDVEVAAASLSPMVGGRVYLRFDHGLESLAARWVRSLRQLFLSRLNV